MKKTLLFSLLALATTQGFSQRSNQSSVLFGSPTKKVVVNETNEAAPTLKAGQKLTKDFVGKKTRASNERWYTYTGAIDTLFGGNGAVFNNATGLRMWQDSTVKQVFTSGAGMINYSSYYNVFDPVAPAFNNSNYSGEMSISATNPYTVDSVIVWGSYVRPKGGNPDTLVISVVKQSATASLNDVFFYNPGKTSFPEMVTNNYVTGNGSDTMMSMATLDPDVVTAYAKNKNSSFVIKQVLTDADTSSFITPYVFAIPNLTVDAGQIVGTSVTFKSGNSWVANVDTVTKLNNFLGIFSEESTGSAQQYFGNAPDFDLNMSGLMFSTSRDSYFPSFFIEGWNSTTFRNELAWIDYHATCTNCLPVATKNISSNIEATLAPNPAQGNVALNLNLKESAKNVTVEFSNAIGQVVKTVQLGAINANNTVRENINIADLSTGMYIYTIHANGQKISNKLMVK